ncbi:hypothetical protein D3C72_1895280 [compost metagenome]
MAAVGEGREVQGNDLEVLQVAGDFLDLLARVQPHAQATVAGFQGMAVVAPQGQRNDDVVAVGDAVQGGVLVQQVPGLVDHLAVLNDSLHIRAP